MYIVRATSAFSWHTGAIFCLLISALAMSSGASPLASPGMSPQGSPMADRRRPQSPGQLQANATSTPTSEAPVASLTVCVDNSVQNVLPRDSVNVIKILNFELSLKFDIRVVMQCKYKIMLGRHGHLECLSRCC